MHDSVNYNLLALQQCHHRRRALRLISNVFEILNYTISLLISDTTCHWQTKLLALLTSPWMYLANCCRQMSFGGET
jgi:hypothetical protein